MTDEELEKLHFEKAMLKMDMTQTALLYTQRDILTAILAKVSGDPLQVIEERVRLQFDTHLRAIENELSKKAPGITYDIYPQN
jgi:hypothetical protein